MPSPDAVVARARSCCGARFRLHGRDPTTGVDCVGLAAFAFGLVHVPTGYRLRTGGQDFAPTARALGLVTVKAAAAGDLILFRAGPMAVHLAIHTGQGVIHADTRFRRVVETHGLPDWPIMSVWRRKSGDA